MKRLLIVFFALLVALPLSAITLQGEWDIYFVGFDQQEELLPGAESAGAYAVFSLDGVLWFIGENTQRYRWQLDTYKEEITVRALDSDTLLWVWHYRFLTSFHTWVIVCTAQYPGGEEWSDEVLTLLVRRPE